jgi:hypothetical protein
MYIPIKFKILRPFNTGHPLAEIPEGHIGYLNRTGDIVLFNNGFGLVEISLDEIKKYPEAFQQIKDSYTEEEMRQCWDVAKLGTMEYDDFISTLIL